VFRGYFLLLVGLWSAGGLALADPLSKKTDIDFFRDVPSRNLKGLAARSDGRLVAGPSLTEITAPSPADLLWSLEPTADPNKWLVASGPDGRIVEVTFDFAKSSFTARDVVKLEDPQVFAVRRLADGSILAGTSPKGALYLIRNDKAFARVALPVDSIIDLLLIDEDTALAATGNPGRIYKIDLKKFATVGLVADKITDAKILADRGITVFGEIRDRNVRRIVALADGRIAAGSAPKGNVYTFPREGGAPVILQENRDAEVTDLLPQPNGDLYATIIFSNTTNESRIAARNKPEQKDETPPLVQPERFGGRSALIWFPVNGFAEVLTARSNTAFYRIARRGDTLLVAGGEQGELVGYDVKARLSLTFAGSISAQVNALMPLPAAAGGTPDAAATVPDRFLILRNNAPGFGVLDFAATGVREAETRRLDLATNSQLGALRFNRLRNLAETNLAPEIRTSNGSDEVEGWGPWTALQAGTESGWRADNLRGRYVKLRVRINAAPGGTPVASGSTPAPATNLAKFEIDRASLFGLPQNRRPQLQDFRVLTPGFGIIPAHEPAPSAVVSLSQVLQPPKEEDRRRSVLLGSQVVPSPGTQVILWTVTDPDNDILLTTFSLRRDGTTEWTDVVSGTRDSYAQFDTKNMPDGVYFTRLVANETAPRPVAERLSQTFETDDLIVDHTAPELLEATAQRTDTSVIVTVHGRDQLSLLDGIEVIFNNGVRETVEQPADGVRDGREETFSLDIPLARVSNATSLEVTLYDSAGNGTAKRLTW
jgi:hypothetical protein